MLPEIIDAFKQNQGFSLLIKGDAGTGKTTVGLEIVIRGENPMYVSTRVSPGSLYGQFPWVESAIPPASVLDATNVLFPSTQNLALQMQRMISFQGLPKFIEAIYHRVNEKKNVTAVIDSWDAVIKNDPEPRNEDKTITSLTELIRRISVNLILITEHAVPSFLDYLVDGILHLDDVDFAGRRMRLMTLKKMRGVLIKNKRYVFTLDGGRVTFFPPNVPFVGGPPSEFKKLPAPGSHLVSSGIADLDRLVQIPRGSTVNIEVKRLVGVQSLAIPIAMMLQNGIATVKDVFPDRVGVVNRESVFKPFFENGIACTRSRDLKVNVYSSARASSSELDDNPDLHLVIDSAEGVVLFYGENPHTKLHVVQVEEPAFPAARIIPVV